MNNVEISNLIERFLSGSPDLGEWEWDDFTSIKSKDVNAEKARKRIVEIGNKYPDKSGRWCSKEGERELLQLAKNLKDKEFRL